MRGKVRKRIGDIISDICRQKQNKPACGCILHFMQGGAAGLARKIFNRWSWADLFTT